jgi:hypothetical protein
MASMNFASRSLCLRKRAPKVGVGTDTKAMSTTQNPLPFLGAVLCQFVVDFQQLVTRFLKARTARATAKRSDIRNTRKGCTELSSA